MGNIFSLLLKISPALEAGQSLGNASGWSNVVTASHSLVAVFGILLIAAKTCGFDLHISDAQVVQLAGAIASVGGTAVAYLHVATNPNAGIKKK